MFENRYPIKMTLFFKQPVTEEGEREVIRKIYYHVKGLELMLIEQENKKRPKKRSLQKDYVKEEENGT